MTIFEPTVRRQALGADLRKMRKAAGYTLEDAAKVINISQSLLSRIETGHRTVSPVDVSALIGAYSVVIGEHQANPAKRAQLIALAEESDELGWWQRNLTDYARQKHTLITLESKAETIVHFDALVIPGLLQTDEYAQAVMVECGYVPHDAIDEGMNTRKHRQSVLLRRNPPALVAVIDELALHRLVGGHDVLRRQLHHLVKEADRDHVSLRVIPNDGQAHGGIDGPFIVIRRPALPPVVFVETLTSCLFVEDHADIELYELVLRKLLNRALSEEESVSLVANLATRLDTEASTDGAHRLIHPDLA
jgi:transcriptional regulator with XRE-family HTH domain